MLNTIIPLLDQAIAKLEQEVDRLSRLPDVLTRLRNELEDLKDLRAEFLKLPEKLRVKLGGPPDNLQVEVVALAIIPQREGEK